MAETDFAVVVGINTYQHLEDLAGAVHDAAAFERWLLSPTGGAVPAAHIKKLDPVRVGQAGYPSTNDVDRLFDPLRSGLFEPVPARTGRRLYIFLAGHGYAPDINETALLMANASRDALGFRIPARKYADWFRMASLFEEVVVFVDCCRDDYGYGPLRDAPWNLVSRPNGVRVHFGLATKWARSAREKRFGNSVNGLFTKALLAGLNAGRMSATELKNYIHNYLPTLVDAGDYQEPDIDDRDPIIFSEAASRPSIQVEISFAARRVEDVEILDGDFELIARHDPTAGTWTHTLEIGQYVVRVPGTNDKQRFEVIGEQVHVRF